MRRPGPRRRPTTRGWCGRRRRGASTVNLSAGFNHGLQHEEGTDTITDPATYNATPVAPRTLLPPDVAGLGAVPTTSDLDDVIGRVDVLYNNVPEAHAEALAHLAPLWKAIGQDERAREVDHTCEPSSA